jgi:hypothetical protein
LLVQAEGVFLAHVQKPFGLRAFSSVSREADRRFKQIADEIKQRITYCTNNYPYNRREEQRSRKVAVKNSPLSAETLRFFYGKRGRRRRKWGSDFANFRFVRRSRPVSVSQSPCFCTLCAQTQSGYPVEIDAPPLSPTAVRTTEFDMAAE